VERRLSQTLHADGATSDLPDIAKAVKGPVTLNPRFPCAGGSPGRRLPVRDAGRMEMKGPILAGYHETIVHPSRRPVAQGGPSSHRRSADNRSQRLSALRGVARRKARGRHRHETIRADPSLRRRDDTVPRPLGRDGKDLLRSRRLYLDPGIGHPTQGWRGDSRSETAQGRRRTFVMEAPVTGAVVRPDARPAIDRLQRRRAVLLLHSI
jgi:hypothetical protein